ncbi:M23 family metallopeptidase [Sphingobium baderi]|uniref:Peptidase M23 n=1 Tax=Sphingobium baderi TaxID=1332080 RepID=A0A0S3F1Z7_9SPHN|nr:peptidase M23 [Sphingobium baderi]
MRIGARGWAGIVVAVLLCVLFLSLCVRIVPADAPHDSEPLSSASSSATELLIPVEGVPAVVLTDTFTQSRANGARPHDAIDIMAARGSTVLAAADGRIEKLFWSEEGGRTVYERSPDGRRIYYYAHLDSYAPGLHEGQAVRRGDRIAAVGSTGNADPSAPHLHFAVHVAEPREPWHGGRAVNPYPLFARSP